MWDVAAADGCASPLGLAGLWENWKDPTTNEWVRTYVIITAPANGLVATIHDRMPAILHRGDFDR
jgi:putative SOS response-associated peptidase YedK